MTVRVVIVDNPLDPRNWESNEVDDAREFLLNRYAQWPATGRVYDLDGIEPERAAGADLHRALASRDVTPRDDDGIARLGRLRGPLLVTVAPADPVTAIIAVVAVIIAVSASLLLMPKLPKTGNETYQSPNNQLTGRTNRARPAARIPDIFGTVRSVPDLLSVPYRTYEGGQEVETAYLCVGRGAYSLDDVKEGDTPLSNIAGASAAFYGPGTSPNSGDVPQLLIGPAIADPVYSVVAMNDVNGQTVKSPNAQNFISNNDVQFIGPDKVMTVEADADFTAYFEVGDQLTIAGAGGLDGTFPILGVTNNQITLGGTSANGSWQILGSGNSTGNMNVSLTVSEQRWVGPFVVYLPALDRVLLNFLAQAGLYSINNKGKQAPLQVDFIAELTPVNPAGNPIGAAEVFPFTIVGSATDKDEVGATLTATPTFSGRTRVRVRRVTPTDRNFDGTIVDEVRLVSGFGLAPVSQLQFGDVTTVHVRSVATAGAASVKERRFNLLATRRLPQRQDDGTFAGLAATARVDAIISAVCTDPQIGNRPAGQVDFADIYATVAQVEAYFGSPSAVQFGLTFDDDNTSFEEIITTVAQSAFCKPYRQGSVIRIAFEGLNPNSALLFNHRNTLPRSQETQTRFGVADDQDGIELDWTDPDDAAPLTYRIPADGSALQPRKVEVPGVRNYALAAWHAWRAWLRLQHQNVSIEQDCTEEAALLMPTDRARITDLNRAVGMEGEVTNQEGLVLILSQPCEFAAGVDHVIYLQHTNETVELIGVTPVAGDPFRVRLARPPSRPLIVDPEFIALTRYEIVPEGKGQTREFLIVERDPNTNFSERVRAINYTPMYYDFDGLQLWLSMEDGSVTDFSAWRRDAVERVTDGGPVQISGGFAYEGFGDSGVEISGLPPLPVYTKTAWVNVNGASDILSGSGELFRMMGVGTLQVAHGPVGLTAAVSPGWHMVAAAYDGARLTAYVDGERAASVVTPRGEFALLKALGDVRGRVADVRLYGRALDAANQRALYRATRRRYS